MRFLTRPIVIAGLTAVAALGGSALAGGPVDKATGGGQILLSSDGRGPGDTIAFQAHAVTGSTDDAATGTLNVVDRTGNTGKGGVHFRGDVTCIQAEDNVAKLAGTGTYKNGSTSGFTLVVTDNGEGAAADDDVIALQYTDDPTCDREDGDDDTSTDLARGNAQVTDAS